MVDAVRKRYEQPTIFFVQLVDRDDVLTIENELGEPQF